jgi:hypothetical protein
MPLAPTVLAIEVENPHYVRVPMEDGARRVIVHVSTSSLRECALRDHRIVSNLTLIYCAYREAIEAAASLKYDRADHRDNADIVLVASEIV